jgi:hypothetical protein
VLATGALLVARVLLVLDLLSVVRRRRRRGGGVGVVAVVVRWLLLLPVLLLPVLLLLGPPWLRCRLLPRTVVVVLEPRLRAAHGLELVAEQLDLLLVSLVFGLE